MPQIEAWQEMRKRQDPLPTTTPTPTSTTTTTTTSSTSSSTPSSSSSSTLSSTSSLSTSSTPSSTVSSSSSPSSSSSRTTSAVLSTRSDGGVVTITLTQTSRPTSTAPASSGGDKGFWENKAAVGAVFGIGGLVALVLLFLLVTTCMRRRRAKQFDKDVAEAAAQAAAANADPFYGQEDERNAGANWDPRRTSNAYGYGRLHDDPFGYGNTGMGATAITGAGAAGLGRQPTGQFSHDSYGLSDLRGSNTHASQYSGGGGYQNSGAYGNGAAYYMNDMPQAEYSRPSFSSAAPGIAGVGAMGAGAAAYGQQHQQNPNLRHRGQQSVSESTEDAYGGYAPMPPSSYPNPYDGSGTSAAATSPASPVRSTASPPPNVAATNAAPPSYSGHGHGSQNGDHSYIPPIGDRKVRPMSSGGGGGGPGPMAMSIPQPSTSASASGANMGPVDVGTPDERWGDQRILRVANE